MSNLFTHTLSVSFRDLNLLALRGKYGVNMNNMITLKSLNSIFYTYILP